RDAVELRPDRDEAYPAGSTATLLVQSPFERARGLLVLAREGFREARPIVLDSNVATIEIPLPAELIPSLEVHVALVRGRDGESDGVEDRQRPRYASGVVNLGVAIDSRRVRLTVTPSATAVDPGGEIDVTVTATGAEGEPV